MPYANVNAGRIFYEQHGRGPDLVFLHGAGGNHLSWWQQLPAFAQHFRCTVFDARGWGLSRGEAGMGRYVFGTDVIALMDYLGIERAHVAAHSMGGRAVAGILRLAPARVCSLVLSGTNAGATNDRVRELQDVLREERGDGGLRNHAYARSFESEQPGLALLYRQINALNPPRPKGLLGRPPANYRGSTHELIASAGVPVLFIVGEHDRITSRELVREAHGLVPGSAFHVVEGAGHSSYFERPQDWNATVLGFLRRGAGLDGAGL
jgi:pimeloyl-ACP methyl ester carboxylesterase